MTKSQTVKPLPKQRSKVKTSIIFVSILLVLYVIGFLNPITGNYLKYPYYELFCGRKPVVTSDFMGSKSYYTSDMKNYKVINMSGGLYCTENEARSRGYSRAYGE